MNKNISTEILINTTKEKVWTILADFDIYKSWNPFMIGSSGQALVATKLTNTMKNKDSQMKCNPIIMTVGSVASVYTIRCLVVSYTFYYTF